MEYSKNAGDCFYCDQSENTHNSRHSRLTVLDGGKKIETSCASLCFGSRIRWNGATVFAGIVSLESAGLFALRLRLTWPTKSGGFSIVARCDIERPLCVEIVRRS